MGLFTRVQDMITANLNEMIDRYEDPEQMLRQAVGEMEQAVSGARPEVAKSMAFEKMTRKELAENEAQVALWRMRAEAAMAAGDDELARKALVRKKEFEAIVAALRDQHAAAVESSQTLRRQLEAMQAKMADAQRRLGTLIARRRAANIQVRLVEAQMAGGMERSNEAFAKFDRLRRKVCMAEAEAEALSELAGSRMILSGEYGEIAARDADIEAELAELKRKVGSAR